MIMTLMIWNMKKYHIKIKNKVVHRTDNMKKALQVVGQIFRKGHEDVSLHGGRLGKWWNK
jgi:hypothetical protein